MYVACRHIKSNGLRCASPALKGARFCYFHSKIHTIGADTKFGPLQLPPPEDPAAIQLSVARINDAVLNGRLDLRKAEILFNGLRIAARFITRKRSFDETDTVQSAEQTATGDELAPDNYVCDHDEDCNDCPYSASCPRCIHPGNDESNHGEEGNKGFAIPGPTEMDGCETGLFQEIPSFPGPQVPRTGGIQVLFKDHNDRDRAIPAPR
ncbi:MAG TPA: hypothetical protein VGI45_01710 [Terracidiphilus sp.]|jgi:hypothetical protein